MNLELWKKRVLKQAKEKGWGTTPGVLSVSEKIALIHVEISEAYEAFIDNKMEGRHGFYEEMADLLQRILHLGGAFSVSFIDSHEAKDTSSERIEKSILQLHMIASRAYENYRHKNDKEFLAALLKLAHKVVDVSRRMNFDIEEVFAKKFEINKKRVWDPRKLRGRYGIK